MSDVPVFANVEVQLAGWTVSHQHGAKLSFWIAEDDLEPFKALTARHGKIAGQRLGAAFVLIGDDEQPVRTEEATRQKGGPLSQLAGMWCADIGFQGWLAATFKDDWLAVIRVIPGEPYSEIVASVVRRICKIDSRAQLDHNPAAKERFNRLIREPYARHLAEREERSES